MNYEKRERIYLVHHFFAFQFELVADSIYQLVGVVVSLSVDVAVDIVLHTVLDVVRN